MKHMLLKIIWDCIALPNKNIDERILRLGTLTGEWPTRKNGSAVDTLKKKMLERNEQKSGEKLMKLRALRKFFPPMSRDELIDIRNELNQLNEEMFDPINHEG